MLWSLSTSTSMLSLLVYLAVTSTASPSLVHRPHGIRSLSDYSCLFTALDHYGQSCQRNECCHEEFEKLWHPLSMRKFVNKRTGSLTALRYGEHDESQHYSSNDENTDFTILSLDFISPVVCAVKVQVSVGETRYTNVISLLKTATSTTTTADQTPQEQPSSVWKIVQELSSSMDMSNVPSGCLLPPHSHSDIDTVSSNRQFGPPEEEEVSDTPSKHSFTHPPPLLHTTTSSSTPYRTWSRPLLKISVKRPQHILHPIICRT